MDAKKLVERLAEQIRNDPYTYRAYEGHFSACKLLMRDSVAEGVKGLVWLSESILGAMPTMVIVNKAEAGKLYALHREVLLEAASYDFDSDLQYVEWDREPGKKFYMPRRKQLKVVVDAVQDLHDDKLDLLAISMPPVTVASPS